MNQFFTDGIRGSVIIGYLFVLTSSLMTIFHMGILALILSVVGSIVVSRNIYSNQSGISLSHFRFQRRNMLMLLVVMGGLYIWLVLELLGSSLRVSPEMNVDFIRESINNDLGISLLKVIGQHWLIHTAVSLLLGLFVTVQTIRGILRYSDRSEI